MGIINTSHNPLSDPLGLLHLILQFMLLSNRILFPTFMTTAFDTYAERARDIFESQVKRSGEAQTKESAVVIVFPKICRYLIADTPEQAIKMRAEFMEQYVGVDVGPSFTFNLLGNPATAQ